MSYKKRGAYLSKRMITNNLRVKEEKMEPVNELTLIIEDVNCTVFGCGKTLSLIEKLCGNVCNQHSNKPIRKPFA